MSEIPRVRKYFQYYSVLKKKKLFYYKYNELNYKMPGQKRKRAATAENGNPYKNIVNEQMCDVELCGVRSRFFIYPSEVVKR